MIYNLETWNSKSMSEMILLLLWSVFKCILPIIIVSLQSTSPSTTSDAARFLAYVWNTKSLLPVEPSPSGLVTDSQVGWICPLDDEARKNEGWK